MKGVALVAALILVAGTLSAHSGENHTAGEVDEADTGSDGTWSDLSGAYPSQTMPIVLGEIAVVALLTFLAVRHRLQLRSK